MPKGAITISITKDQADLLIQAIAGALDRTEDETARKRLIGIQLQANDGLRAILKKTK